ncbi:MAG: hypothetical protein ACLQU1_26735 [Bryobacteraceae bacterium]
MSLNPAAYGQGAKNQVPAVPVALASGSMPVAQQNALVQKYCAVCHTDAKPTGGLSLEKFDAAHPDPSVAAMMVSKLKARAMGAAGIPLPDRMTQDALLSALSAGAVGAGGWTVNRTQSPTTQAPILMVSVLQEVPSARNAGEPDMYRLTLTCHVDTHEAEMQLAWAPGDVPQTGGAMSAAVDGKVPSTYTVDQGEGAAILYATKQNFGVPKFAMPLPAQTLTISNLFPGETVVFPFGGLTQTVRQALSTCFTGSGTSQ